MTKAVYGMKGTRDFSVNTQIQIIHKMTMSRIPKHLFQLLSNKLNRPNVDIKLIQIRKIKISMV